MGDRPACRLLPAAFPRNPAYSDRAPQQKHRSLEPDFPRLRNLPGGWVKNCPASVPLIARIDSFRRSRDDRTARIPGPGWATPGPGKGVQRFYTAWTLSGPAADAP